MDIAIKNIFADIPKELAQEQFIPLLKSEQVLIERIVSKGQHSDWFDQDKNEWVVVLQGQAILSFKDDEDVFLQKGDFIHLPTHLQHRVKWTDPEQETIWLAIHY